MVIRFYVPLRFWGMSVVGPTWRAIAMLDCNETQTHAVAEDFQALFATRVARHGAGTTDLR